VTAGSTEIWEVRNSSELPHSFHVHGTGFRVVDIDGNPPPPALAGPKDTVYVSPQTTVRLLIHFGGYADPNHPYMFHSHVLAHEDSGMMGQFVVVRPGQTAGVPGDTQMQGMAIGAMEMGSMP
jgi:FtsP/CotA-like multicopper oxidase with cupredoxin domain